MNSLKEHRSVHRFGDRSSDTIIDVKSSWDIFTFFRTHSKDINSLYYWQLQGVYGFDRGIHRSFGFTALSIPRHVIQTMKRESHV
jgi:hypothetical protein